MSWDGMNMDLLVVKLSETCLCLDICHVTRKTPLFLIVVHTEGYEIMLRRIWRQSAHSQQSLYKCRCDGNINPLQFKHYTKCHLKRSCSKILAKVAFTHHWSLAFRGKMEVTIATFLAALSSWILNSQIIYNESSSVFVLPVIFLLI